MSTSAESLRQYGTMPRPATGNENEHNRIAERHSQKAPKEPVPDANSGEEQPDIEALLRGNPGLWRGCDMAGQGLHGRSTGFPQLDDILPGRGWPEHGLIEVISSQWGMGELQLLIPLMRAMVEQGKWILWISPPYLLYAPALVQSGIDTRQVLVVKLDSSCKDALWGMEKALQTSNCGLVLAWQNWLPGKVLRRLQLAAETGNTLGVIFKHRDSKYSPALVRMRLQNSPHPGQPSSLTEVTVIKARGNFRPLSTTVDLYRHYCPGFDN